MVPLTPPRFQSSHHFHTKGLGFESLRFMFLRSVAPYIDVISVPIPFCLSTSIFTSVVFPFFAFSFVCFFSFLCQPVTSSPRAPRHPQNYTSSSTPTDHLYRAAVSPLAATTVCAHRSGDRRRHFLSSTGHNSLFI